MPLLYGVFFAGGRAVGGLVTGTRLVRVENGGRLGVSACWAMLVRVLFPLWAVVVMFNQAGGAVSLVRTSIDEEATRRLHANGFLHL